MIGRLALLGVLLVSVAGAGAVLRHEYLPRDEALPGLRVDGEALPAGADLRAFVTARAEAMRARHVTVTTDGEKAHPLGEATLGELGVDVDVERVIAIARRIGHDGDLLTRAETAARARRGEIDVPLQPRVDPAAMIARFDAFKETEDTAPVSARLDLDHHAVVPEADGKYLDLDGAAAEVARVASDPNAAPKIVVPWSSFKPRVSREYLSKIDISHVLASFSTMFSRGQGNRSRNIEVAASRVNGLVLMEGQAASFNEVVGPRSVENGFKMAFEIFKGEMVPGIGGGTCQVASTLHAIAFFGGLDVIERLPHSRPSAYIPLGLDATVVYPAIDLKLRNPFPFPVVVRAFVDGSKITMELLGPKKPVSVTYASTVIGVFPFTRKIVEEGGVEKPTIKQRGIKGVQIRRARTMLFADGDRRVETSIDLYPPTQEIYRVPPGYNADELPPVGEDPNAKKDDDKQAAAKRSSSVGWFQN